MDTRGIGRFNQNVFGTVFDFTVQPAHNTSQSYRFDTIGYNQAIQIQFSFHFIQGSKVFPIFCLAHQYGLGWTQQIIIKGMKRLIAFQHNIIGNINYIVDRTNACTQKELLHPFR
jgi:hypothetical protein